MPPAKFREAFATFAELEREFGDARADWLSAAERERLRRFRHPGHRAASAWGRVLSKQLLLASGAVPEIAPRRISIESKNAQGQGVEPTVSVDGVRWNCRVSISHTQRAVQVAVSRFPATRIGVDLVDLDESNLSVPALRTWFTPAELDEITRAGETSVSRFWAAKEAAFKACQRGERFTPRRIEISPTSAAGFTARCHFPGATRTCEIAVREQNRHVVAVALAAAPQQRQTQHHLERRHVPC